MRISKAGRGTIVVSGGMLGERLLLRRMPNGLLCGLVPRPGFAKKFAVVAANYGSIDNVFISPGDGARVELPAGVAHFLEHKMFDKKSGCIFDGFSALGANANAFTGHSMTAYHFSCTRGFWECLELLVRLVRDVYLTRENVQKEVGIIQQEILMYQDEPEWQVATGLVTGLYHRHPVRIDTAGTVESVAGITRKTLLECFRMFYSPANLMLAAAGEIDPGEFFEKCERLCRGWPGGEPPAMVRTTEPGRARQRETVRFMDVARPKVLFGFKEPRPARSGVKLVRQTLETDLLLGIIFGKSSPAHLKMYDKRLIDESFSASYSSDRGFGYSAIGGDTERPRELVGECLRVIGNVREKGIGKGDFARLRKRLLGAYLRRFNSLEVAAIRAVSGRFLRHNPFRVLDILNSIRIEDLNARIKAHLREEAMAVSVVLPLAQEEKKPRTLS
jgi:predicted Zn-dependent peptidase